MSLKQRAVKCSGYIPPSQYVPVYSRRGKNGRLHEELSPLTPKPTLDDPYNGRNRSIHEAVKLWLESSPNSVIGPSFRCRSPSSGSPPSHSPSSEKVPAILSGLTLSPLNIDSCTPDADCNLTQDDAAVLSPILERNHPEVADLHNGRDSDRHADVARSNSLLSSGFRGNEDLSRDERSAHAEAVNTTRKEGSGANRKSHEERKWATTDVYSRNLRSVSKEFDAVLAAAAIDKKKFGSSENPGSLGIEPSALPPELVLKPPRKYEHVSRLEDGDWHSGRKKFLLHGNMETSDDSKSLKVEAPKNTANLSVEETTKNGDRESTEPLPRNPGIEGKRFGIREGSSFKKLDEVPIEGAKRYPDGSPQCPIGEVSGITPGDPQGILQNGVLSVAGRYEFSSARRPAQPPNETTESVNDRVSQRVYEASDLYSSSGKSSGTSSQQQKNSKSSGEETSSTTSSKKDKVQAKLAAWETAKNAIFLSRYKREESKIHAWEEQKIAKANQALTRLEAELQKKRAKETERIASEVAKVQKQAEEKRASADRRRAQKAANAAVQAQIYRVIGKSPVSCFCF